MGKKTLRNWSDEFIIYLHKSRVGEGNTIDFKPLSRWYLNCLVVSTQSSLRHHMFFVPSVPQNVFWSKHFSIPFSKKIGLSPFQSKKETTKNGILFGNKCINSQLKSLSPHIFVVKAYRFSTLGFFSGWPPGAPPKKNPHVVGTRGSEIWWRSCSQWLPG